jgi:hypothetical protein
LKMENGASARQHLFLLLLTQYWAHKETKKKEIQKRQAR